MDEGPTVVVIEHHFHILAEADYLIDIGRKAGAAGGEVVAEGTPETVTEGTPETVEKAKASRTGPPLPGVL